MVIRQLSAKLESLRLDQQDYIVLESQWKMIGERYGALKA